MRLANLTALARATERYQQQRAELARLHERQRIAEGLHDDVAQFLFAAQLNLDGALEREGVDRSVAEGVSQSRALLVRADTTIRTVINRLSSPPAPDLALRLASAVSDVENVFSQPIHLEISPDAARVGKRLRRGVGDMLVQVARHTAMTAARREGPRRIGVVPRARAPRLSRTHGGRRRCGRHAGAIRVTSLSCASGLRSSAAACACDTRRPAAPT